MARRPSLVGTISLHGVAAACIPVVVLGLFFLNLFSSNLAKEISERNLLAARMAAREVYRLLDDCRIMAEHTLERLMKDPAGPIGSAQYDFEALLVHQGLLEGLKLLDSDLTVRALAPFRKDQLGVDMSGHPFVVEAAGRDGTMWSGLYLSGRTGMPAVSLAVCRRGWVLVADLDLSVVQGITDAMKTAAGGYAAMTDGSGSVIAHPVKAFVRERMNFSNLDVIRKGIEGKEGSYRYEFLGEERLGSVAVVPEVGWLVFIVQPAREAFSVVRYGRGAC
jgi:hypothetical protein